MPILADYHVHSSFSGDSDTPMEQQIQAALRAGLTRLCFTEHYDPAYPYEYVLDLPPGCFEFDEDDYRAEVVRLKKLHRGRIRLLCGVELGLQPHLGTYLGVYLEANPHYDFVIGSTHVLDGKDPYYPSFYEGRDEEEIYRSYFEHSLKCIRAFHDFDSYGHLDFIVRYGPTKDANYTFDKYRDVITPLLDALLEYDIALEVNTSAMREGTGCLHMNPLPRIIQKYREMGGNRITIGSDAHIPARVGFGFSDVCSLLKDLGFTEYTVFEKRKPIMLPLN